MDAGGNGRKWTPTAPLAIAAAAICAAAWMGWGWWGYGATGDYSLELADAIRVHLGHVPYRDFIPTYGILTTILLSPFFALGARALPALWIFTLLLIGLEGALILQLVKDKARGFLATAAALMFVFLLAFIPSNSRYIMGYSTAGFVSVILWTLFLLLSRRRPVSDGLAGLVLGLQLHTKMDASLLAVALAVFLMLHRLVLGRTRQALKIILGFLLPSVVAVGLLLGWGARPELIWGSTAESLGQAAYVRDVVLGHRLLGGAVLALLWGILLTRSEIRISLRRFAGWIAPLFALLFFLAMAADGARLLIRHSPFGPVAMHYLWFAAWLWVGAAMSAHLARSRSWKRGLLCLGDWKFLLLAIAGFGFLRCAVSGWFPLNYYQPAALLLAILVLGQPRNAMPRATAALLGAGLVAAGLLSLTSLLPGDRTVPFETPYGTIRLPSGGAWTEPLALYQKLRENPRSGALLSTYMTGAYLATGREPAGLYTYWHRLSASGRYRADREKMAFEKLRQHPPAYVLLEKERASFAPAFGSGFGLEIFQWILQHYQEVARFENDRGGRWLLLQRSPAP